MKKKIQLLFESGIFKSEFLVLADILSLRDYGIGFGKHWAESLLGRGETVKHLKGSWVVQNLKIAQLVV